MLDKKVHSFNILAYFGTNPLNLCPKPIKKLSSYSLDRPKDIKEFELSLDADQPPFNWPVTLQSLWWDAKGDWDKAHDFVDQLNTPDASWIHAYLHRKEGDLWNAGYWYNRAGRPKSSKALEEEFAEILDHFLLGD